MTRTKMTRQSRNRNRASTTTDAGTVRYLYDGDNVVADIDSATGLVVRSYVMPMLDSNVSMTVVGTTPVTYFYNQDERQSVMNLTDSTGAVVQSYGYSAYGDPIDTFTHSN